MQPHSIVDNPGGSAITINNIGGDITQPISPTLIQAILLAGSLLEDYGDGSDGPLVLVADTALASQDNVKNYSSVDLAGFTLRFTDCVRGAVLHCQGNLAFGTGGKITNAYGGKAAGGAATGSGAGAGGKGGNAQGALMVFMRTFTGTGTIGTTDLADGEDGGNAVATTGNGNGTSGFNPAITQNHMAGQNTDQGQANVPPVPAVANGDTAGGAAVTTGGALELCRDTSRLLRLSGFPAQFANNQNERWWNSGGGAGGSSGADTLFGALANIAGCGAGGGGGVGKGGKGAGPATPVVVGPASGGGGGGSGASGSFTFVKTTTVAGAGLIVSAKGGAGGQGGAGSGAEGQPGGDAGAGGGGLAVFVGPAGSAPTLTAAHGTEFTGFGGADAAADGIIHLLVL